MDPTTGTSRVRLLTARDVGERLSISPARVYEAARLGLIPAVRIGRQIRFSESAIEAFVEGGGRGLDGAAS